MLDEFRSTSITWDKATRRIYSPISANESDSNGRKLNIQVVNSGQVENLTGATLHLYWETKDKAQHGLDAFTASDISKGEFEIFYTTGMLSNVGELNATLVLVDSTGQVVSDWFKITVTRGINESAIQSENSFSSLTQALIDISDLEQNYAPRLNDLNTQLAQTAENFEMKISEESAGLGAEMVTGTGWTSAGWTGDYAIGFTHTTGNTTPLTYDLGATAGGIYLVELTVDDTDLMNSGFKFAVTIGDSEVFQMYQGVGGSIFYSKGIKAVNNGDLKIIPNSDFTGTVKGVSVKPVTGTIDASTKIKDSTDKTVLEIRPTKDSLNNVFVGKNAGQKNVSGMENTIIGNNAMENSITGFWNSALGYNALKNNINGSRSLAIGFRSLEEMISGHRNIALGTFALHRVTSGANNIGIGADSAWHTTTGEGNIAIGTVSLDKNTTGSFNIAIGYNALRDNLTTSFNVAIGHHALRLNTTNNNTAIGAFALSETVASGGQTAIGYQALKVSTGTNNTAVGQQVGLNLKGGNDNTVVGRIGLLELTTGTGNTVIGSSGARYMTEGNRNTLIGNEVGRTLTSGNENILIGNRVTTPTAETNNHLNIGNLIYGDLATKKIGIGLDNPLARLHLGAGTTSVPPIRINGGTLLTTPMNGAIESDGSYLYFTNSAGNRLRIVAENIA